MEADVRVAELARTSGPRLLRLAYQLTHDQAAAEDVVQEALMRMCTSWRRHMPRVDHVDAYARRAVVNEFLRGRRRRAANEIVTDAVPETAVPEPAGATRVDAIVDRDAAWRALAALPDRQRAVLVLRYYEDLPDDEIATLLNARPATVRSLAARGLATLRSTQPAASSL